MRADQFDILVAGAGPVGLTLAIDLGRRGVETLIVERQPTTAPWPKMDRTNARSMEIFRRLGIADRIRELGYPPDNPMDVFLLTRMTEPALAVLRFPSVAERRAQIASRSDGSLGLEPYQLVSQNKVEPLLKEVAEHTPNVTVRYGHEVVDVVEEPDGVAVTTKLHAGGRRSFRCRYLVGCDGGTSTVRKRLGVQLQGQGAIRELRQVIFRSDDLYERIPVGKGRHYNFVDGSVIVAQGDRKEFTLHTSLPEDTDFIPVLRAMIGFDCELDIRHVVSWRHHLLTAERYRDGRVFLAGDAAHLVIPTGGLGMNTGVGDAIDLSWKLAGVIEGWGGQGLLDAYEQERRPVGLRNVEAAGWASEGVAEWLTLVTPEIHDDSPTGVAARARVGAAFEIHHRRMHSMFGAEMAYSYAGSPLVADEPGNTADWPLTEYHPHVRPGVRVPHMWLSDGRPLHEVVGDGFTLVDLRGHCTSDAIESAFAERGVPFEVLRLDEPNLCETFGRSVLLLRPDLHIAWSGDREPPASLAARVSGHG